MRSPTLTLTGKRGAIVENAAGTDCENAAFLRLFFGRVGQKNAAGALLGLLHVLDDHAIAQWLQIHENLQKLWGLHFGTRSKGVPAPKF